jgi:hypothetical protein
MSHVYSDRAETEARAAMMRDRTARPAAEEPELVKLYQNLTPEQRAMPANYEALIYAVNKATKIGLEVAAQVIAEEARRTDKRVNASAAKIVRLEASIAELTCQISDLAAQLERDRAARGDTDGRQLASLLRGKPRAALKRKPAKQ